MRPTVTDLITDAYIAACARGLGAEVAMFDRALRRFRVCGSWRSSSDRLAAG
ncbi:MAG: hypothetical protein ACRCYU_20835 [Nocardioides sp.]